jgi:chemotaxis protein methyltransferase CheR
MAVLSEAAVPQIRTADIETMEIELLLEGVFRLYGADFRNYALASLRRRIWNAVRNEKLSTISALQERVLHDPSSMERFLLQMSVSVTSVFRDPAFYQAVREKVIPHLKTYPFARIWHAGCATGEEVYSMAILLHEEGLYERARIYATDMNAVVLEKAREGIFSVETLPEYEENYRAAGGKAELSDYYTAKYDSAIFRQSLRKNIVFAEHNLVTDSSFNEFNVVFCRNVMIYFNSNLQRRVHELLYASLRRFGILALGRKESLRGATPHETHYEELDAREKLYRKVA